MGIRCVWAGLAAFSLAGCMTTGGGGVIREIQTEPGGAVITIDGYGECQSPCTIKLDGPRRIRIAKAGFISQNLVVQPEKGPLVVELEIAAPAGDVDTQTLPDLD